MIGNELSDRQSHPWLLSLRDWNEKNTDHNLRAEQSSPSVTIAVDKTIVVIIF